MLINKHIDIGSRKEIFLQIAVAASSATAAATAATRAEEKAVGAEQRASSSRAAMDAAAHARDDAEAAAVGAAAEAASLRTRLEQTLEELERVKSDAAERAARERDVDVVGSPRTPATRGGGGRDASPFGRGETASHAAPSRYTNEETAAMTDEIVRRRVREAQLEADAARLRASLDAAEGALRETREKLADAEAAAAAAAAARGRCRSRLRSRR